MTKKAPAPLPANIRILGVPHTLEWNCTSLSEGDYGDYDEQEHRIRIGNRKIPATVLHEITHAILNSSGLAQIFDDKQNEAICVAMENGMLSLVPLLARVLKEHSGNGKGSA